MKTEDATTTVLQFKDLCRTCLKEVDLNINIFKYMLEAEDNVLVSEALEACLPIRIEEDDRLPHQMCSDCLIVLSETYRFLSKCLQTHATLQTCINAMENKDDDGNVEELITIINEHDNEDAVASAVTIIKQDEVVQENEEKDVVAMKDTTVDSDERFIIEEKNVDDEKKDGIIEEMVFKCHLCPANFAERDDLVSHVNNHTEGVRPYACDKCHKRFNFKHNLIRHMLIHDGVKKFACTDCGKAFVQRVQLQSHIRTHEHGTSFICEQCGTTYKYKHFLERHIASIHTPYNHLLKIEKLKVNADVESEPEFDEETPTTANQKEPVFLCSDCGKPLRTKMALKLHMRVHTGEKPHVCEDCGKSFAQGSSLIYHRRIHTGEKPYICGVCGRNFVQPAHLKTHMKTHTGEKPYECPYCGKYFALKKNMIVHSRIHTGERPFACSLCDKKFVDASSRKKHFRGHQLVKTRVTVETPMYVKSEDGDSI